VIEDLVMDRIPDDKYDDDANPGVVKAIQWAGSQELLANALGVSQPAISKYLYDNCPAERAVQIENVTGVDRKLIRPDLFGTRKRK
jgi:DNA-binding transcriptional regulator YdaS (Cro superfamily)